jgi:hypothetical protein
VVRREPDLVAQDLLQVDHPDLAVFQNQAPVFRRVQVDSLLAVDPVLGVVAVAVMRLELSVKVELRELRKLESQSVQNVKSLNRELHRA